MELRRRLANSFAAAHPAEAAAVLEGRPAAEAIEALSLLPDDVGAAVLRKCHPVRPHACWRHPTRSGREGWSPDCRSMQPRPCCGAWARKIGSGCSPVSPPGSPRTFAPRSDSPRTRPARSWILMPSRLAETSPSRRPCAQYRASPSTRSTTSTSWSREGTLIGVLNLLELLQAPPRHRLDAVAQPALHRLFVHADRPPSSRTKVGGRSTRCPWWTSRTGSLARSVTGPSVAWRPTCRTPSPDWPAPRLRRWETCFGPGSWE